MLRPSFVQSRIVKWFRKSLGSGSNKARLHRETVRSCPAPRSAAMMKVCPDGRNGARLGN